MVTWLYFAGNLWWIVNQVQIQTAYFVLTPTRTSTSLVTSQQHHDKYKRKDSSFHHSDYVEIASLTCSCTYLVL